MLTLFYRFSFKIKTDLYLFFQVSFVTITDKRDGQQRAAGVTLLLDETLQISKEKRERVSEE